jgi:peptidylprolyl isomerase
VKFVAVIAGVFLSLTVAACAGGRSSGASGEPAAEAKNEGMPQITVPKRPPPNELVVDVLDEGSGTPIKRSSDEIVVNYVGVEYKTGHEFYNSWKQGRPSKFLFGEVHAGWEKGLIGMRAGGRRELIVPPRLAYGTDTLIYVVDLVAVKPSSDTGQGGSGLDKPKIEIPHSPPPRRLIVRDIKTGSGPVLRTGDEFLVNDVGVNYRTGKEFETTWGQGRPSKFPFGTGELIQGWERGLAGMRVGGRRELIVPSALAYKTGALIYVIDLLAIE